jgi:hypothetical protein
MIIYISIFFILIRFKSKITLITKILNRFININIILFNLILLKIDFLLFFSYFL